MHSTANRLFFIKSEINIALHTSISISISPTIYNDNKYPRINVYLNNNAITIVTINPRVYIVATVKVVFIIFKIIIESML
ncbi:hypothetical protein SDC9_189428 [bioreactor metagenome]|uniref:Uncharacterized protein n=1 Tax=bioreactor metagenome TaxID=1076179 RepID=A0A645I2Y7_9ZZZZ